MDKLEIFGSISGMKISNDELKISKFGANFKDEEIEYLKSIGINDKSRTKKINFLGHIIIPNQLSTDTTKAEEEDLH